MEKVIIITDVGSTTTKALLLEEKAGRYEVQSLVHAPTSVEKPEEDVKIGIIKAISKLEAQSGRTLLSQDETSFLKPGIGYYCTSSAGGGLQILVIGLTTFDSAASGKRCAYGAGAVILDTFAVNDKRSAVQQMKAMSMLHPDIILMTGGTDGGAVAPVLRLAELIQFANPRAKFTESAIPLIFAGNVKARELIKGILSKRFKLHIIDNVRPDLKKENPGPARDLIHHLFMEYVMQQAPGYANVLKLVDDDIIPTPRAVLNAIELLQSKQEGDVMMVDIGGATTDVFSNMKGEFYRTVSANYGMSYSIANVFKDSGRQYLEHYLPEDSDLDLAMNYIADKMLYPTCNPADPRFIYIEHIMARAALYLARQQHLEMNFNTAQIGFLDRLTTNKNIENMVDKLYFIDEQKKEKFYLHDYKYVIGAGGVISHTQNKEQALMMIADGLQTQGLTLIMRDRDFISPHLGKLSQVDAHVAEELLIKDCLEELGWHIRPQTLKWKAAKPVMEIYEGETKLKVLSGKRYFITGTREKRKIRIILEKKYILNDTERELEISTALPVYIDTTFPESKNDIATIREHYSFKDSAAELSEVFPLYQKNSIIEKGSFRREIKLPYLGEILVEAGETVQPDQVVAQNLSDPPRLYILTLFEKSMPGLTSENFRECLKVKEGEIIKVGQKIVVRDKLSLKEQMYGYADHYASPVRGMVENINYESGTIILHEVQDYSEKPVKVKISDRLGIKPKHIKGYLKVREGDFVYAGDLLAAIRLDRANKTKSVLADKMSADKMADPVERQADTATYNSILSPATGSVKAIDLDKGTITIHYDRQPLLHNAGVQGKVAKIIEKRSVLISYEGYKIQGIIGFGREAVGKLVYCSKLEEVIKPEAASILVVDQQVDHDFLKKVEKLGYKGLVAPSIHYRQLIKYTGEDIGVALTGNETIGMPLVFTQGFGEYPLPQEYQDFFAKQSGAHIFIDGHTQIRAGVIRPQIIIQEN